MSRTITLLLADWAAGQACSDGVLAPSSQAALDRLMPLVLPELRRLAGYHLARERANHTLSPTEIVHEAFLKLVRAPLRGFDSRTQFFALASKLIRDVLVDHARARRRAKRGGEVEHVPLAELRGAELGTHFKLDEVLAVDEALTVLEARDPRQSQVVQLRFFAGLTLREVAQVMGLSLATVERLWATGRRRLARALEQGRRERGGQWEG